MKIIVLYQTCIGCGTEHTLMVYERDYLAWQRGAKLSKVFGYLSPSEREMFFLSHLCDSCWDEWTL